MGKSAHMSYWRATSWVAKTVSVGEAVIWLDGLRSLARSGNLDRKPPLGRYGFPVMTNDTWGVSVRSANSVASVRFSKEAMIALWEYPNTATGVRGLSERFW